MNEDIFDIIESALAKAGYKIVDGDANSVIVRDFADGKDYEIKINENVQFPSLLHQRNL